MEHGTWPQCERLLPQAVTVAQVVEQYQFVNREAGRLLCIWEQLGPQHPETAEIIHDLARFWEAQDNGEEASAWYARALAVREPALGAHHPKTTETRKRFIALLHALGQHEEATQLEAIQFEQ